MSENKETKQGESKQAIVQYTRKDINGTVMINIDAFSSEEKKVINGLTKSLMAAMQEHASSMLKIGKVLCDIRGVLENKGDAMKGYVNSIPGFSQATAYRYMARYENGSKILPKPLLDRTLSRGLELVGVTTDAPFGRYTDAIKKIEKDPKAVHMKDCKDEAKAEQYLNQVIQVFQKMPKGGKETVTLDDMLHQATKYIISCYNRLSSSDKKVSFFSKVFGFTLEKAGFKTPMNVVPLRSPEHWEAEKRANRKKAGRPKKGTRTAPATSDEPNEE